MGYDIPIYIVYNVNQGSVEKRHLFTPPFFFFARDQAQHLMLAKQTYYQ